MHNLVRSIRYWGDPLGGLDFLILFPLDWHHRDCRYGKSKGTLERRTCGLDTVGTASLAGHMAVLKDHQLKNTSQVPTSCCHLAGDNSSYTDCCYMHVVRQFSTPCLLLRISIILALFSSFLLVNSWFYWANFLPPHLCFWCGTGCGTPKLG